MQRMVKPRRSVTRYCVFLNDAPIAMKSKMQEAELVAATLCMQEMLYIKKMIELLGMKLKFLMTLAVDNKGTKDLIDGWSVGGRTRHIDVLCFFLCQLN